MSYNNGDLNGAESCIADARAHVNEGIEAIKQAFDEAESITDPNADLELVKDSLLNALDDAKSALEEL